jgi:hypothetical protein
MGRSVMIEGGEGDGDADSVRMAGVLLCAEIMADSDWASDSVAPSGRASVDEPRCVLNNRVFTLSCWVVLLSGAGTTLLLAWCKQEERD